MPYKSESIKLPEKYDRRIKLSTEQKDEIRHKYQSGEFSQRKLAAEYGVSRRTIQFVTDDSKRQRAAEQFKERRKDGRYKPTREEHAEIMREHRKYKQDLYNKGLIK